MHALVPILLWVPPAVLLLVCVGCGIAAMSAGTTTGRFSPVMYFGVVLVAALALCLHAGYFLAPLWWPAGRGMWALGLMLPIALAVLALILAEPGWRMALVLKHKEGTGLPVKVLFPVLAGGLILYWTPPALMLLKPSAQPSPAQAASPAEPTPPNGAASANAPTPQ